MIKKRDLSVVIAARNEEFLARTVQGVLKNKRGNTDVIVILDGAWAEPALESHSDLTIVYHHVSVGQRAACNEGAKLSQAKYIMKLDAHCVVDEGFDVKMIEEMRPHYTMVPIMYNLHVFNWKCKKCGNTWYQSPTPKCCMQPAETRVKNEKCDGMDFERVMIWKPRWHRKNTHYRFDETLHFQYWGALKKRPEIQAQGEIADSLSLQGSCFMLTRKKWFELNICDEWLGSWGQQGTEVACKTWLSGGEVKINKKTWYSHMFRTQGGNFGFPYPQDEIKIEKARQKTRDLFFNNKYDKQIYPFSWLINKFKPIPDWHDKKGKKVLDKINRKGKKFVGTKRHEKVQKGLKGIIYYTDNQLNLKIAHACKKQIKSIGLPIFSASLKPMPDMGKNICLPLKRGYLTYFKQILAVLELADTDVVFFCEHDWLYHPSHFEFTPPRKDVYYYNDNWWRLRLPDGHAITYNTHLKPALCCYRDLAIQHHQKIIAKIEKEGLSTKLVMKIGFEPGTHNRDERVDDYKAIGLKSEYPNIDIRHGANLTASRWKKEDFRSERSCRGWQEAKEIPGWGKNKNIVKLLI